MEQSWDKIEKFIQTIKIGGMKKRMFCSKCGMMIDDDSRFCSGCGAEVVKKKIERKKIFGTTMKIVMMFLFIGALCIIWIKSNTYVCSHCHEIYMGEKYCSKADESREFCNMCIEKYYPNSWELYFERR